MYAGRSDFWVLEVQLENIICCELKTIAVLCQVFFWLVLFRYFDYFYLRFDMCMVRSNMFSNRELLRMVCILGERHSGRVGTGMERCLSVCNFTAALKPSNQRPLHFLRTLVLTYLKRHSCLTTRCAPSIGLTCEKCVWVWRYVVCGYLAFKSFLVWCLSRVRVWRLSRVWVWRLSRVRVWRRSCAG